MEDSSDSTLNGLLRVMYSVCAHSLPSHPYSNATEAVGDAAKEEAESDGRVKVKLVSESGVMLENVRVVVLSARRREREQGMNVFPMKPIDIPSPA